MAEIKPQIYRIEAIVPMGRKKNKVRKEYYEVSEKNAIERFYSEVGGLYHAKRHNIKILNVSTISVDECTDDYVKTLATMEKEQLKILL